MSPQTDPKKSQAKSPQVVRQVPDGPHTLTVELTRDGRLSKSARWTLKQHTISVRVPPSTTPAQVEDLVDDIVARVLKQRASARRRNDIDLEKRARHINRTHFNGAITWHTIRWVSNMKHRLGSFTTGGTTDGDIRISDRIKLWPDYVIDYVIAHELAHRIHPNHSEEFWAYLARYPLTERARGFIEGIAYAEGQDPDAMI